MGTAEVRARARPLYASLVEARPPFDRGNVGLWYDKYCDQWQRHRDDWTLTSDGGASPKLTWIEEIANGGAVGNAGLLAEAIARLHRLTEARRGGFGVFTTESRFVTGLGRSHPIENGFAWHPTLGVPYLPGSSIKGLVRAWARRDAEPAPSEEELQELLGRADSPRAAGRVVFLDAVPMMPVRLEADVMTPHHANWTPEAPPGDWREPVPVPFLVVAPQTSFFFAWLPRRSDARESDARRLDTVFAWLREALLWAGAGAKTAVGYGRFAYDEPRTAARQQERAKQRLALEHAARRARLEGTPEGRWLAELEGKREGELLDLVRTYLEKASLADVAERRAFARAVAETPHLARWRRGEKEDRSIAGGPGRLKELARIVDAAAASKDEP